MTIKAIYIDDEINRPGRDAQKLRDLLIYPDQLEIELQYPPHSFADFRADFDLVLIDLDLSLPLDNGDVVGYFGTTLASELRMRNSLAPIVLVTRPNVITGKMQYLIESVDIDYIVFKDDINKDPLGARAKLLSLCDGFRILAQSPNPNWPSLIALMTATEEEANLLREAAPPVEKGIWTVPQISRWIRNIVIEYPGILYDELTAATRLGISLGSFNQSSVLALFDESQYRGVFSSFKRRWWRGRLFYKAQQLMLHNRIPGSIPEKFRLAFQAEYGQELEPAICIYDGTPTADWVCYILNQPVKQRNSIPYYPDRRPSVMDQARVSYKAIQESDAFDETLVDAQGSEIVKSLWK
ncbi:MAG: hypothetical protein ABSE06_17515 [Anaerolineaceae bacterium]|jgi:hypothetical protein